MLLAFDISSSVIGISSFDDNGKLLELDCLKFKSGVSLFDKLNEFSKKIEHYKNLPVTVIAIEEPLKKFQGKFSNANTISLLNFFNGMISAHLYTVFNIEPVYFNVNFARKVVFPELNLKSGKAKHEVWKGVMTLEPQINWRYSKKTGVLLDENFDMSDAYTVGMAYILDEIRKETEKNAPPKPKKTKKTPLVKKD